MSIEMTSRQRTVYDYIVAYNARCGITPTVREIRDYIGVKSLSQVATAIEALEKRGVIRRVRSAHRGIEIVQKKCPHCGGAVA